MTEIRFDCQHCGQSVEVSSGDRGKSFNCPGCRAIISVPWQSAPERPERKVKTEFLTHSEMKHFLAIPLTAVLCLVVGICLPEDLVPYGIAACFGLALLLFLTRSLWGDSIPEYLMTIGSYLAIAGLLCAKGDKLLLFGCTMAIVGSVLLVFKRLPLPPVK